MTSLRSMTNDFASCFTADDPVALEGEIAEAQAQLIELREMGDEVKILDRIESLVARARCLVEDGDLERARAFSLASGQRTSRG